MTNNDQQVIKSGQTQGVIENWTFDPPIDEKLPDKFICVVFDNDILRLLMTTNDQKVVKNGQTQGLIEKWTSDLSIDRFFDCNRKYFRFSRNSLKSLYQPFSGNK